MFNLVNVMKEILGVLKEILDALKDKKGSAKK